MNSGFFKDVIYKKCLKIIYLIYMYKKWIGIKYYDISTKPK